MIKKILFIGLLASVSIVGKVDAQGMAVGATTPDASAMFEVRSTAKGLLIPRLTTTQRNTITTPATGLQVYNTTTNTLEYFNGTAWISLTNYWSTDANGIYYSGTIAAGGNTEPGTAITATQTSTFGYGAAASFKSANGWQTAVSFINSSSNYQYNFILAGSGNTDFPPKSFALYNTSASNGIRFVFNTDGTSNSFLAIGSYANSSQAKTPKSRLHVFNGDVNIEDIGKGIIMKSPNGNCWRVTIDDSGNLVRTSITCP